jgi:leader peptidase (prepilin peptidase)/N-methyltransferase
MDPAEWPVAAVWIGVVVVGLVVGSFLNVVILRLPAMLQARWQLDAAELLGDPLAQAPAERFDLISPRSRCPHCATPIKARHNLPVLGYLLLGGRCATCGGPISIQYPLVEIAAALLGVLALARFGLTPWGGCIAAVSWALWCCP